MDEALALARQAADIARGTDALNRRGDSLVVLAEVLAQAGHPDEAIAAVGEAIEAYEQKGNAVSARDAGALLARLQGGGESRRQLA